MSFPRGFYQMAPTLGGFVCDETTGAFVRGILVPTPEYNAMSVEQRLGLMQLDFFPRWRLYGGPFSLKSDAEQWDDYLPFWGFSNNLTWVSHGTRCIVPDHVFKWPADQSVKWEWVWEVQKPAAVAKTWNQMKGQYDFTWAQGGIAGVPPGPPPSVPLPPGLQKVRWA